MGILFWIKITNMKIKKCLFEVFNFFTPFFIIRKWKFEPRTLDILCRCEKKIEKKFFHVKLAQFFQPENWFFLTSFVSMSLSVSLCLTKAFFPPSCTLNYSMNLTCYLPYAKDASEQCQFLQMWTLSFSNKNNLFFSLI